MVLSIGLYWSYKCNNIPNSVILVLCFQLIVYLTSCTIGSGVTSIGRGAFHCSSHKYTIPIVLQVLVNAFKGCKLYKCNSRQ